ncbi:MAG TPA: hypothetical protein VK934_02940 [Fimbriimonas sp.]|nr:hypothetical protein [Fimbriimonas sp.]
MELTESRGWSDLTNGKLLAAATTNGFHCFITTDTGLRHQQNLKRHQILVISLELGEITLGALIEAAPILLQVLERFGGAVPVQACVVIQRSGYRIIE